MLEAELRPRAQRRPRCSRCQQPGPGYDTLARRRFEFVPLWGIPVFFCYAMRRVDCPTCGVRVETVPWAAGKHQLTTTYAWFLARWAKRLSWTEVAGAFRTTWEHVFRSVELAVAWGRQHQDLSGIAAIGLDEIQWRRGHQYLTLVYQLDAGAKRLLWLGEHRQVKTLRRFFRWLGPERSAALRFICSDMWKPYLRVVAKKAGHAIGGGRLPEKAVHRRSVSLRRSKRQPIAEIVPGCGLRVFRGLESRPRRSSSGGDIEQLQNRRPPLAVGSAGS